MSYIFRYRLWLLIVWLSPIIGNSQDPNTPVPYTLADRDRMMRMELEVASLRKEVFGEIEKLNIRVKGLDKKIDGLRYEMNFKFESQQKQFEKQFENIQRQIDDFKSIFFWITGVIISLILMLFSYIVWDRHTFVKPFHQQQIKTTTTLEKIKNALFDFGNDNSKIKEALERQGLE